MTATFSTTILALQWARGFVQNRRVLKIHQAVEIVLQRWRSNS
jgi:hypothetical protein